jgi:dethiobiotin synthetase
LTIVLVTGTGTEVGKTFVTAALARALRADARAVVARKPVLSYAPDDAVTDADVLAEATGENAAAVCPQHRRLALAMAPPMAAEALDLAPFTIAELVAEIDVPVDTVVLVESVGGVGSPLAADGDTVDLAAALSPALVVLVADAGLGTINLVRLSVAALAGHPIVVFLNRYDRTDELHRRNADWLRTHDRFEVITDLATLTSRVRAATHR